MSKKALHPIGINQVVAISKEYVEWYEKETGQACTVKVGEEMKVYKINADGSLRMRSVSKVFGVCEVPAHLVTTL